MILFTAPPRADAPGGRRRRASGPDLHHRLVHVVQQFRLHHLCHPQSGGAAVLADRAAARTDRPRRLAQLWHRLSGGRRRRPPADRLRGHRSAAHAEHTHESGVKDDESTRHSHELTNKRANQKQGHHTLFNLHLTHLTPNTLQHAPQTNN